MTPQTSESPKLQRTINRKKRLSGFFLAIILLGIVGFFLFTTFSVVGNLRDENEALENQLSQFLNDDPITTYSDKTFVRYEQNPLSVTVYTSATCNKCDDEAKEIIAKLQASLPTLQEIILLDTDDKEVQSQALEQGVGYLPGIVFSQDITQTTFYEEGKEFFSEKSDGSQQFYTHALGHAPAKYIATTKNLDGFPSQGTSTTTQRAEASNQLEIHAFLTTDCPACKTARDVIKSIEKSNPRVKVVEHFSEKLQKENISATRAIACAHLAGKGEAFTDRLFARQAAWLEVNALDPVFARYATSVGIDNDTFSSCLSEDNIEITRQDRLFQTFGLTQVPTIFINNIPFVGVQTVSTLNQAIAEIDVN